MHHHTSDREKRSVLITGASSGIGRACAISLSRAGWSVFAGVRRELDGEALQAEAETITPIMLDVTDQGQIREAIEQVSALSGECGLDGLINSAGIVTDGPIECIDLAVLREQLEVNVIGVAAVTQAAIPLLRLARSRGHGAGRIVMISSISGRIAMPFIGPYAMSKFALEAMSDSLRRELVEWGIRVSLIEPGPILTPIWEKSVIAYQAGAAGWSERQRELYGEITPLVERMVTESQRHADPVEKVVTTVQHALTSRRPRVRYVVGRQTRVILAVWPWLPERVRDWVVARELKRMSRAGKRRED